MPIVPNMRRRGAVAAVTGAPCQPPSFSLPTPVTYVDHPTMNYVSWLQGSASGIASFKAGSGGKVAIIGAGAAGLVAAYELLRCGLDVTLYEATDRAGGRLYSVAPSGDGNLFEMGAMRFTPSERILHYYAAKFGVAFEQDPFPDPGLNLTYVAFQGQTYTWDPNNPGKTNLPPSYCTVAMGWAAFLQSGFTSADGTIKLVAPNQITTWLSDPSGTNPQTGASNAASVVSAWQGYIDAFANASLYDAIVRIFTDESAPGKTQWKSEDFEFYGALGTGFGGFGPLFPVCFLDIMRFVINAVDSDQHGLLTGVVSLVNGFLDAPITQPNGATTTVRGHFVPSTPVYGIASNSNGVTLTLGGAGGAQASFDRVIVAASHRSMELTMGLGQSQAGTPLAEPVADAIRRVHLMSSSKVFVECAKFWELQVLPRNVVGDTILRNMYTLDYTDPLKGVLLFSYTWGDDSVKQFAFADAPTRVQLLLRDLGTISPVLAEAVKLAIGSNVPQLIDWDKVPYYSGAFKLNEPGQDLYVQSLFFDFLKAGTSADTYVYVAGDSVSWMAAWVEGPFQTGLNAAAAVATSLGGTLSAAALSPFSSSALDPAAYNYSPNIPTSPNAPAAARGKLPALTARQRDRATKR